MMTICQQGEAPLERIGRATGGLGDVGRIVLAHGEEGGHTRSIEVSAAAPFPAKRDGQNRWLCALSPMTVDEKRSEIPLPEGLYRAYRQHVWSDGDGPVLARD